MGVTNVSTWATSAILGAAFHAGTQWLEPDLIVPQTAACFAVLALAGVYVDVQVFDKPLVDTATTLAIVTFGFLLSLTVSTLVYRVFFHRLRKFPGPFAAKLSKFYSLYLSRNLQYHFEAEKLHKKYGDVVRTGPRELSIARISPLNQIITCQKTNFYTMTESRKEAQGLSFKDDIEDHRRARRAWDISLTPAQISKYNAAMQSTITLFLDRLAEPERVGKPVNITDWISWLGYDIMGVVGFGRDFGCLRNAKGHPAIKTLQDFGFMLGLLKHVPWLGNILTRIPGGGGAMAPYARYCKSLVREKIAALSSKTTKPDAPTDVVSWLIKAFEEKKPYAASSIEALDDDARALVIGGADTASATLTNALYNLSAHPSIQHTLHAALAAAIPRDSDPSTWTPDLLDRVPLLDAVVTETLRLQPPVPSGQPRLTPPQGLHIRDPLYGDISIPGDTVVVMPQWVIQRDERYFERATEFVPGRWVAGGAQAHMVRERAAWFPFQVGMYYCVGKQLAMWEMKSVVARTVLRFHVAFAEGEDGEGFVGGIRDTWTLTLPELRLRFTEREG
ncbi:Cytochrome P450 67 [Diplodia seriata]|uniref:Cytochrome P450 67 n=1 Tax=Diplodia seriata TaxID=420778 RepID=A0A1S8BM26_9PEZI|nr:Cytochrome P450 67 [Diplodia seriata]